MMNDRTSGRSKEGKEEETEKRARRMVTTLTASGLVHSL